MSDQQSQDKVATRQPAETKAEGIRVFVYGTLKRGHCNHPILADGKAQFLGRCYVEGEFRMLDLSAYPCVVRTPGHTEFKKQRIFGETYLVDQDTLDSLDILEGNGKYFTRSHVWTPWKKAWMYFLPPNWLNSLAHIPTGMWRPTDEEKEFWYGKKD